MSDRALTWSYGGGTQSAAIAVLIAQDKLPKPECSVIADTGREQSETWAYLRQHVQPLLASVGVTIHRAPHSMATVDLYSKSGKLLIPAFTPPNGKLPTFCSTEWKKRVVQRYLRQHGYGPGRPVDTWIGFSLEEAYRRMKPSGVAWQEYTWPLVDLVPRTRNECRQLVLDAGLPDPPRSSCWMCPYHTDEEWRHIKDKAPVDWAKAVVFDEEIRRMDTVYVHRSFKPLSEVTLDSEEEEDDGRESCESGHCFV